MNEESWLDILHLGVAYIFGTIIRSYAHIYPLPPRGRIHD